MTSSFSSSILKGKYLEKIIMTSQVSTKKAINQTTNHLKQIAEKNGVGALSASQLSSERAIFVMLERHLLKQNKFNGYRHKAFAYGSFINPRILDHSVSQSLVWQQCPSYPHLKFLIKRSTHIIVQYQRSFRDSVKTPEQWKGFESILFQHQISHMNCINLFDICEDVELVEDKNREDSSKSEGKLMEKGMVHHENKLKLKQYFGRFKQQRDCVNANKNNTVIITNGDNNNNQQLFQDPHNSKIFYKDCTQLKNFIQYEIINPNY